ncbi:MAG: arginine--tRNA ligase [bacterium]|nr:arginine--tRNA ligase [bacterium]
MSIIKELEKELCKKVKKLGYPLEEIKFVPSSRPDLGDYQINDAMNLGKILHCNPREIAEKIMKELETDDRLERLNIAGPGFINISLSSKFYLDAANKLLENLENNIDRQPQKKIFIDYGGANIAKTLHVGHLRPADIGEAIKRLTKLLGQEVISDVHFGDIGRQSGMVIYEMKERFPDLVYFKEDYNGEEAELPITKEDLQEIYPTASAKAKENDEVMEIVRDITIKIEEEHPGYTALWNKIKELSKEDIKEIYEKLNTTFDLWEGETDCYPYLPETIDRLKKQNLLYESEGALVVDVKEDTDTEPMPPLVILKGNGGTVYQTRDLATLLSREKRFAPDEVWYFTDNRQELYFKQVFRVAKKGKIVPEPTELKFFGIGTMNDRDGKPFKTRDGGVMSLVNLMELVKEQTLSKINTNLVEDDKKHQTAEQIAIAALKYADLLPCRNKDFIFDINKFADMDGKTGTYLLYSTVRMKSLITKWNQDVNKLKITKLKDISDQEIIKTLLRMPVILTNAYQEKSLNEIAEYLYKLTSTYNKFYAENHILKCEDEELKHSWIALTKIVYDTNKLLLNTLGIEIPEKM